MVEAGGGGGARQRTGVRRTEVAVLWDCRQQKLPGKVG